MGKILFMTNVIRRFGMMQRTMERLKEEGKLNGACRWLTESTVWDAQWESELRQADFVLLKWMGTGLDTPFLQTCLKFLNRRQIPYYIDAAGSREGELKQGLEPRHLAVIKEYCLYGGERNYYNLWQYLAQGRREVADAPTPMHWCGIYHPRAAGIYTDLGEYQKDFCDDSRPYVGVLFYREEWVWGDLTYQSALVEALEANNLNAVCVFSNGMPDASAGMPTLPQVAEKFFFRQGAPLIDVLINTLKFSLTAGGSLSVENLKQWNIPVLQAYTLIAPYEEWRDSFAGMNAMEISISVALPEFDGAVHSLPIATKKVLDNGDVRYLPIKERVQRLARKAAKWAALRRRQNKDKKVAVIFHNYPPRNSNIGSALGLDTIESVRCLLDKMRQRGYRVADVPEDTQAFIKELTANATNDCSMLSEKQIAAARRLTGRQYAEFFHNMDQGVREQLIKDWGDAPGTVMEYDGDLLVPGTMNGSAFITVQPPRGFGEAPEKIYHDPFCVPTHQYLAFYRWLRDIWQADAVVHVGTHGNLEWLPGKSAGLSRACYPDLALGDLPNIYPYKMTMTGEGIQAKRRGAACLVEHLPAPQARAGVYDELEELEKLLDEYAHFAAAQPENLPALESMVQEKAAQANLQDEVPYDEQKPFAEYTAALHNYICDLKNMEVHTGLHILGEPPQAEQLIDYLCLLLRLPNGDTPSLTQTAAALYGLDYYTLLENSSEMYAPLQITYGELTDRIHGQCREFVGVLADCGFSDDAWEKLCMVDWVRSADAEARQRLAQICRYACEELYPNLQLTEQELTNILRGLEGQYVEPGPSGAPSSGGAYLLPTGRNFYGVDPRALPTLTAWEIGKTLGEQAIERFIAEEGRYPESIGIVLWSGSNMRSHGQCVSEFLYLL